MTSEIQVYGTDWCRLTFGVREYLTNARLTYDFHDVDRDPQACEEMLTITEGRRRFPLVVVHERILANPSHEELRRVLDEYRIGSRSVTRRPLGGVRPKYAGRRDG